MRKKIRQFSFAIVAALVLAGSAGHAFAQAERFEVTSIKSVRPTLVDTIAALKAGDVAGAKTAFEAYDFAWNGIEVYVNVRSKPMYEIRTSRRCSRTCRRCWQNSTRPSL